MQAMNIHSGGKKSYIKALKDQAKRKIEGLPSSDKKVKAISILKRLKSMIKESDHSLFLAK